MLERKHFPAFRAAAATFRRACVWATSPFDPPLRTYSERAMRLLPISCHVRLCTQIQAVFWALKSTVDSWGLRDLRLDPVAETMRMFSPRALSSLGPDSAHGCLLPTLPASVGNAPATPVAPQDHVPQGSGFQEAQRNGTIPAIHCPHRSLTSPQMPTVSRMSFLQ